MMIKAPLRPIPAEQCTSIGPTVYSPERSGAGMGLPCEDGAEAPPDEITEVRVGLIAELIEKG